MNGLCQPVTACNAPCNGRVTAQTSLSVTASVPMRRQAQRSSQRNGTSVVTEMKSRQAAKSVQLARERAWPPIGGSNENTLKRRDESVWNSETTGLDGQSASNQHLDCAGSSARRVHRSQQETVHGSVARRFDLQDSCSRRYQRASGAARADS